MADQLVMDVVAFDEDVAAQEEQEAEQQRADNENLEQTQQEDNTTTVTTIVTTTTVVAKNAEPTTDKPKAFISDYEEIKSDSGFSPQPPTTEATNEETKPLKTITTTDQNQIVETKEEDIELAVTTSDDNDTNNHKSNPYFHSIEYNSDNKMYFHKELTNNVKNKRIIFLEIYIKRMSDVNNSRETFRTQFTYALTWLITQQEYENRTDATFNNNKWVPNIEFVNAIQLFKHKNTRQSIEQAKSCWYGDDGSSGVMSQLLGFDPRRSMWSRRVFEADITFAEELELGAYPFDCQDFSMYLKLKNITSTCILLAFPGENEFSWFDPKFSNIIEWNLEGVVMRFDNLMQSTDDIDTHEEEHSFCIFHIKTSRRWQSKLGDWLVICSLFILGLSPFNISIEGVLFHRLAFGVTLILADVAAMHFLQNGLPNISYATFMDIYMYVCFFFLFSAVFYSGWAHRYQVSEATDSTVGWMFWLFWTVFHVWVLIWGYIIRQRERKKNGLPNSVRNNKNNVTVVRFNKEAVFANLPGSKNGYFQSKMESTKLVTSYDWRGSLAKLSKLAKRTE